MFTCQEEYTLCAAVMSDMNSIGQNVDVVNVACCCKGLFVRQKLHGPLYDQQGALCQWQVCHFTNHKS